MKALLRITVLFLAVGISLPACRTAAERRPASPDKPPTSEELAERLGLSEDSGRLPDRRPGRVEDAKPEKYLPAELSVTDLEGNPASLAKYEGSWLLVDFFTTYAAPSQFHMSDLEELHKRHNSHGLVIVGISLDLQGQIMVKPFIDELGITYPILLAVDETKAGKTPYGYIREIPVTILVDPEGRMVKGYLGVFSMKRMEADLGRFLKRD